MSLSVLTPAHALFYTRTQPLSVPPHYPPHQAAPALAGVAAIVTAINPGEYVTEVTMIVARIRNFRKQSSRANNKTPLFTLTDVYLRVASSDDNSRWRLNRPRAASSVFSPGLE